MSRPASPLPLALPGEQAALAEVLLAPGRACPLGLRAWNGSDPARRLAVHRNNVVVSLIDALAASFPVVQALVGETFFRAMAGEFVRQQPPRSPVLAHYGDRLPDFIADFEPARGLPYLADVAWLEFARIRAQHAADMPPLSPAAAAAALGDGAAVAGLRLDCHPSVSVRASSCAMVAIWAAHQGEGELAEVDPLHAESALVLRDGQTVLVLRLPPGGARLVAALQQGRPLGQAVALAMGEHPELDLQAVLTLLVRHGALSALHSQPLARSDTA